MEIVGRSLSKWAKLQGKNTNPHSHISILQNKYRLSISVNRIEGKEMCIVYMAIYLSQVQYIR